MDENTAISRARQLLARYEIKIPPVDVLRLAEGEGYVVRESDKLGDKQAGQTFTKAGQRYIIVNGHNHPHRRRFTIMHEVAHHVLGLPSVHGSDVPSDELERFRSRAPEEVLCDVFAAECLIPWQLIQPLSDKHDFSIDAITTLVDRFHASRLCVASRFAQASASTLAYVVAEEGRIKYSVASRSLRDAGVFIRTGVTLPPRSAADQAIRAGRNTAIADMDATEWSHSDAADRFSVHEEAIYQSAWGQTLSLLTFEEEVSVPRSGLDRDGESEELLPELTGYLSWDRTKR